MGINQNKCFTWFLRCSAVQGGVQDFSWMQREIVLMFNVIYLQHYYVLGDHQIRYQIIDRNCLRQFLGIHTEANIPVEKQYGYVDKTE